MAALVSERFALMAWPLLCLAAVLAMLARIAFVLGGRAAMITVLLLALLCTEIYGGFAPGNIDHHGLQMALMLAALLALVEQRPILAAAAVALGLGVGLESLPYALAATAIAALWLKDDARRASQNILRLAGIGSELGAGQRLVGVGTDLNGPVAARLRFGRVGIAFANIVAQRGAHLRHGHIGRHLHRRGGLCDQETIVGARGRADGRDVGRRDGAAFRLGRHGSDGRGLCSGRAVGIDDREILVWRADCFGGVFVITLHDARHGRQSGELILQRNLRQAETGGGRGSRVLGDLPPRHRGARHQHGVGGNLVEGLVEQADHFHVATCGGASAHHHRDHMVAAAHDGTDQIEPAEAGITGLDAVGAFESADQIIMAGVMLALEAELGDAEEGIILREVVSEAAAQKILHTCRTSKV